MLNAVSLLTIAKRIRFEGVMPGSLASIGKNAFKSNIEEHIK